jgi:two-component system phosphate regulon sensor histidine kinase PhoR
MNGFNYRRILYFISIVILITIVVQGYWAYKNYLQEKDQLITDVQISLDQAVDSYYTHLAKNNTLEYFKDSISNDSVIMGVHLDHLISKMDTINGTMRKKVYLDSNKNNNISIVRSGIPDSISIEIKDRNQNFKQLFNDSVLGINDPFNLLTSKIVISFAEDSLSLGQIDSLLNDDLKRKNIDISYGLTYSNNWGEDQSIRKEISGNTSLSAKASSSFIMPDCSVEMHYDDISITVLKRNLTSLIISILLIASIIFCLVYLLRIIQKQKQLSEIKNDLISNITHEFKTPLATIGVALEAIQRFNKENDPEKSKKYAQLSTQEVEKLTLMVEKLLETATLDSNNLELNMEESDLISLLKKILDVSEDILKQKRISFNSNESICDYIIDRFHFENAINNIIDNAIKYGGDHIDVSLEIEEKEILITIKDNGDSLTPQKASRIFEKFYRVPHGNTHDVKGFGIGLYYTKKIIEKHGGTIEVNANNGCQFQIKLPL